MKPGILSSRSVKLLICLAILIARPVPSQGQATQKATVVTPPPKTAPVQKPAQLQTQQPAVVPPKGQVQQPAKPPVVQPKTPVTQPKPPVVQPKPPVVQPKPNVVEPKPAGPTPASKAVRFVPGPAGSKFGLDAKGNKVSVTTRSGAVASLNARGQVSKIQTAGGTTITHSATGARTLVSVRTVGGVQYKVVNAGAHGSYVEHPFSVGGHDYMKRTYMRNGRPYVSIYRGYRYNGKVYYSYVPAYYYRPAFYGWVYTPWASSVAYSWGWYGALWYQPYGYYFVPYNSYSSGAYWLTDYVVSEDLRAAYEAQAPANQPPVDNGQGATIPENSEATLSPEVKQMLEAEVESGLATEQTAAQTSTPAASSAAGSQAPIQSTDEVPQALDSNHRVFIVSTTIDVQSDGQTCSLSPGDVILRADNNPDKDDTVGVSVLSSQKSSCKVGSAPRVQTMDLQEMYNQFRGKLDDGVKALADNQGKKGFPSSKGPATATDNPSLKGLPNAPDAVAAELKRQNDEANQAEMEVQLAMNTPGNARGND